MQSNVLTHSCTSSVIFQDRNNLKVEVSVNFTEGISRWGHVIAQLHIAHSISQGVARTGLWSTVSTAGAGEHKTLKAATVQNWHYVLCFRLVSWLLCNAQFTLAVPRQCNASGILLLLLLLRETAVFMCILQCMYSCWVEVREEKRNFLFLFFFTWTLAGVKGLKRGNYFVNKK